ncbi:hypothetical protein AMTRI_Chr12g268050 [Amborella trichopoda]
MEWSALPHRLSPFPPNFPVIEMVESSFFSGKFSPDSSDIVGIPLFDELFLNSLAPNSVKNVEIPQFDNLFNNSLVSDSGAVEEISQFDELLYDFPVPDSTEFREIEEMDFDLVVPKPEGSLSYETKILQLHSRIMNSPSDLQEREYVLQKNMEISQNQEAVSLHDSPDLSGRDSDSGGEISPENDDYSNHEDEEKGFLLLHLLVAAAEAISNESNDVADVLLQRLRKLVSCSGTPITRVAFYLFHGLQWLFTGKNELSDLKSDDRFNEENHLLAYRALIELHPCSRMAHFTANQFILESISSDTRKLHVIDFDIMDGLQWPPLMEALASEPRCSKFKSIKITAIKWKESSGLLTGKWLKEFAQDLGFRFSFEEMELQNLINHHQKIYREEVMSPSEEEEEIQIVNCMFKLLHMCDRSMWPLSNLIEASKKLKPRLLVLGHCNGELQKEISGDFVSRFSDCLQWASAICDSLEWILPTQRGGRELVERSFLGPKFCREVMFGERGKLAAKFNETNGFRAAKLSERNVNQANEILRLRASHSFGVEVAEGDNELALTWGSTTLLSVSAWYVS